MTRTIGVVTETWPPEINGIALTCEKMVLGMLSLGHRIDHYLQRSEKPYVVINRLRKSLRTTRWLLSL